jgi:hypothetical protein
LKIISRNLDWCIGWSPKRYQDMIIRVETNKCAIKIRKLIMAKIVKLNKVNNSLHVI